MGLRLVLPRGRGTLRGVGAGRSLLGALVAAIIGWGCSDDAGNSGGSDADADLPDGASDADAAGDGGDGESLVEPDPANEAVERLIRESEIEPELRVEGGVAAFVAVEVPIPAGVVGDPVASALDFLERYRELYRLTDPASQLYLERIRIDEDRAEGAVGDGRHMTFAQRDQGIPVFDAQLAVHLRGDRVVMTNGHYLPEIRPFPAPSLDGDEATEQALLAIAGTDLRRGGEPALTIFNLGLVRNEPPVAAETHLAWRVNILGLGEDGAFVDWLCMVDAFDGAVLLAMADEEGDAASKDFDIETVNHTTSSYCWSMPDENDDDYWFDEDGEDGYPGAGSDSYLDGQHAYDFAHEVYDFYFGRYHRHSLDDDEVQAEIMVHVAAPTTGAWDWNNAQWTSGCEEIWFGDGWSTLDTLAHEWSHGIDSYEGNLTYAFQSGALDESFADISGAMVDDADWLVGEDIEGGAGGPLRSMSNPAAYGDADHFSDYDPPSGGAVLANDYGGVHTFSGIINKAFYLLAAGGDHHGHHVDGIGRTKAGALFYWTLVSGVTSNSDFRDVRDLVVTTAKAFRDAPAEIGGPLYGITSLDVCAARNAFAAVGIAVGYGDADCDGTLDYHDPDGDNDKVPDTQDNCPDNANFGQVDTDGDGEGNVCDDDNDGDGVLDGADNCPVVANADQDQDHCLDDDGDGWMNFDDNCPTLWNPLSEQKDTDLDGLGDDCDDDDDGDGAADGADNCPLVPNVGQLDSDGDAVGDVCDNCPSVANDQTDCDEDGIGLACDRSGDHIPLSPAGCNVLPYFEATRVGFVNPGDLVQIAGCSGCSDWLLPEFELAVTIQIDALAAVSIVDDQGRMVARGDPLNLQTLTFRPKASFWYRAPGSSAVPFQGTSYFLMGPPGPPANVTVAH
ncbi:MAG: M4 family metallopeptidase [Deltaproteobacteria bacterium]|nr:M4 family metallopeptidase [Deltaproteobacteria bacterium]